jgi:hypothetical protein
VLDKNFSVHGWAQGLEKVSELMMSKNSLSVLSVMVAVAGLGASTAEARPDMALALRAGTPGFGVDYDVNLFSRVNARVGYSTFSYSTTVEETDATYDGKLKMKQAFGLLDWFVFNGGFRISVGGVGSKTTVDLTGKPTSGFYDIGNNSYPASSIASVDGKMTIGDGISPYVGIGWGNPVDKAGRWTFMFDLGAINAGSPNVTLGAKCASTITTAQCNAIQRDVQLEIADLKDQTSVTEWYPVISFGLAVRF